MKFSIIGTALMLFLLIAILLFNPIIERSYNEMLSDVNNNVSLARQVVDKIIDSKVFNEVDYKNILAELSSRNSIYDIKIERYTSLTTAVSDDKVKSTKVLADNNVVYEKGDLVKVTIIKVANSKAQSFMSNFVNYSFKENDVSLVGGVR